MSKSVNMKSKAKTPDLLPAWRKYSFYFDTIEDCNRMALPIAVALRDKVMMLYFARYTNATEARLDLYLLSAKPLPRSDTLVSKHLRWVKLTGPEPCSGSPAHGMAFEVVLRLFIAHPDVKVRTEQFYDVIHWMNNMAGFDYVDEVRGACYGINKVMGIFEQSIKLGNQMAAAAKKATKKSNRAARN